MSDQELFSAFKAAYVKVHKRGDMNTLNGPFDLGSELTTLPRSLGLDSKRHAPYAGPRLPGRETGRGARSMRSRPARLSVSSR